MRSPALIGSASQNRVKDYRFLRRRCKIGGRAELSFSEVKCRGMDRREIVMSEFSESYHLRTDRQEDACELLRRSSPAW